MLAKTPKKSRSKKKKFALIPADDPSVPSELRIKKHTPAGLAAISDPFSVFTSPGAPKRATMKMKHIKDPKKALLQEVGDFSKVEVFNNQILLAVYKRPSVTAGGIHLSDVSLDEDEWQGKIGLVLKWGPAAFQEDASITFYGMSLKKGDWVALWITDGRKIKINDCLCRIVRDTEIRLRVPHPDMVY